MPNVNQFSVLSARLFILANLPISQKRSVLFFFLSLRPNRSSNANSSRVKCATSFPHFVTTSTPTIEHNALITRESTHLILELGGRQFSAAAPNSLLIVINKQFNLIFTSSSPLDGEMPRIRPGDAPLEGIFNGQLANKLLWRSENACQFSILEVGGRVAWCAAQIWRISPLFMGTKQRGDAQKN